VTREVPPGTTVRPEAADDVEAIEVRLLVEGLFARYGYDFRNYAAASLRRRVRARVADEGLSSVSALQALVLHDEAAFGRLLAGFTVQVTSLFRDPGFYLAVRQTVVSWLRTYPFVRLWVAGCSTGEEVYSLAIVLEEEGLYDRCRLYATDLSEAALDRARAGVVPLSAMRDYTANYLRAGGTRSFSDYYTTDETSALLQPSLRRQVVFAQHDLATGGSFNEFHAIFCRNVMIYFNQTLQDRVLDLFHGSLVPRGILALGRSESLRFSLHEAEYEVLVPGEPIYRRRR